jgi:hypothetical protein
VWSVTAAATYLSARVHSLVNDVAEELETWQNLTLGDAGLDDGGNNGDEDVGGSDVVSRRDGGNVDVCYVSPASASSKANH